MNIRLILISLLFPFIAEAQSTRLDNSNTPDFVFRRYEYLLKEYRDGHGDFKEMPWLANTARWMKQRKLADSIGQDFIRNYLSNTKQSVFFTKNNIVFFVEFNQGSDNKAFRMFYRHSKRVDKVMKHTSYAENYIDYMISKEEIDSHFYKGGKLVDDLDWTGIEKKIKDKYSNDYAKRNVINAQVRWYYNFGHSDTSSLLKCVTEKMEKYGLDTVGWGRGATNNLLYAVIFRHSTDLNAIVDGVKWAKYIVEKEPSNPEFMDTYANLLYKSGRREEAIEEDEKALSLDPDEKEIQNNLQKMKRGQPTWAE